MGGTSVTLQADSFLGLIEHLIIWQKTLDVIPMSIDSATFVFKDRGGKYVAIGSKGIETAVHEMYGPKLEKPLALLLHAHT